MAVPIVWTDEIDGMLIRMRKEKQSWDEIATAAGVSRWTARARCVAIGATVPKGPSTALEPPAVKEKPIVRDMFPLPAGHPITWGAISRGVEWPYGS